MTTEARQRGLISITCAVAFGLTACGGGSGSAGTGTSPTSPASSPPPATPSSDSTTVAAAGVYKGTLTESGGATSELVGFVDPDGQSLWMTPDGRVFDGEMPAAGTGDETHLRLHTYDQDRLQEPVFHEDGTLRIERHAGTHLEGQFEHGSQIDSFRAEMQSAMDVHGSLESLAGVYTRSSSSGYTMTMAITRAGEMTASDTLGCQWVGDVSVPAADRNLYRVHAEVTGCGELDGTYTGLGALLDAEDMQAFMQAMHPFEHGEHAGEGSHGHSGGMPGQNVVPTGTQNLWLFGLHDEAQHHVILDALAR